jgi:hypothetical protein
VQGPQLGSQWLNGAYGLVEIDDSGFYAVFGDRVAGFTFPGCSACEQSVVAGCLLSMERYRSATTPDLWFSAGDITGLARDARATISPEERPFRYAPAHLPSGPHDLVTISAAGAEVPAFTGTLRHPRPGDRLVRPPGLAPVPLGVARTPPVVLAIDRNRPLEIQVEGESNHAEVLLTANWWEPGEKSVRFYLHCPVDLVDGLGAVPAEALSSLPAGQAGGGISVRPQKVTWLRAGAWIVALRYYSPDAVFSGDATFQ